MLGERSKVFEQVTCGLYRRLVVTMGALIFRVWRELGQNRYGV